MFIETVLTISAKLREERHVAPLGQEINGEPNL